MEACRRRKILLFLLYLIFLCSCATPAGRTPANKLLAYTAPDDKNIFSRYLPVFVVEHVEKRFNRIGAPAAKKTVHLKEKIYVDHEKPAVYVQKRTFRASKGEYTNLIYRIHFEKVPYGLVPFYLGSGNNVGLIVAVTLNDEGDPILYTTVHTCGCYLAFVPTSYMPEEAFPDNWEKKRQYVYFEDLPGLLDYKETPVDQTRTMILIKDGSHRVKDMWLSDTDSLKDYNVVGARLLPMESLEKLPVTDEEATSFYETSGPRKGYVKGSHKPWERLFMSWWALDWRVGEDKKFGEDKEDGPVFYTSLKRWDRKKSDMRDFAAFLKYWGWSLP